MARAGGFYIDAIPGQRWEIALELLRDGGRLLTIPGEVPVGLQRYAVGPAADGRIHVSIFTEMPATSVTPEMARRDAQAGLAAVATAEAADPRLTELFEQFGVVFEYVYDYETGALKIGDVAREGAVTML